jgi:protein-S-isoprenylcysteine O-methyltransferase Ste14
MKSSPERPQVRIIPPLVYLAGLVIGMTVGYWLPTRFLSPATAWTLGGVLMIAGAVLVASAVGLFARKGTTVRPDRAPAVLVVDGPFTFTRNPMYLGLTCIYLGVTAGLQSLWALIILPVVLYIIWREVILKEEAFLERRFGSDYLHYKERVRRWL